MLGVHRLFQVPTPRTALIFLFSSPQPLQRPERRACQLLARLLLLGQVVLGCSPPVIEREPSVVSRPQPGDSDSDSALVVLYDSRSCALTIRDRNGQLHDRLVDLDRVTPIDMTRETPSASWYVQNSGYPSQLATVIALPPGRYTVVSHATTDDWGELEGESGAARGETDCSSPDARTISLPFRIEPEQLTLLALPTGAMNFDDLRRLSLALHEPTTKAALASWLPAITSSARARHLALAAKLRERRDGYDVYRNCDGKVAVVRNEGTPFAWYENWDDEPERERFRARARPPAASVHATGFGGGCVLEMAFHVMLSNPAELEHAADAAGSFLVRENLRGEIDLYVRPVPVLLVH